MIDEIQHHIDEYSRWLKDNTLLRQAVDGWVEITTPHLDRHNDCLQIYARKENGSFILSDDGYTLDDLELSGFKVNSPKRKSLLQMTLNGFGVELDEQALITRASPQDFPRRKHGLIQAMLAVNDLFYLSAPWVAGIFLEDVTSWLDLHEIRHVAKVKLPGKTGFDHMFDFVIPKSTQQPERLIQALNKPERARTLQVVQAWVDTQEVREEGSQLFTFLNDREKEGGVSVSIIDALKRSGIFPVLWSEREEVSARLAA